MKADWDDIIVDGGPTGFLAVEALDIDDITGGFNFQFSWTTGRLAGNALSE